jgi:PilZ domain
MLELQYARRSQRRSIDLPCELVERRWDEPVNHRVTDISQFGVWVRTSFPLPVEENVVLSFLLPGGDEEITVFARVSRVIDHGRRGERGMALEYVDLTQSQRIELAKALRVMALRPEMVLPITSLTRRLMNVV